MEITEEQIKELHELSKMFPSKETLTQKIEQWFPECLKQKLEVGKWYKSEYYEYIIFNLKEINNNICFGYGANGSKWYDDTSFMPVKSAILATTKEVESMLIKEAEKRGLIEGVKINKLDNYYYGVLNTMIIGKPKLELDGDILVTQSTNGYNTALMKDGKWATIVETPKEMTLEEIEKQLGHKVKIVS